MTVIFVAENVGSHGFLLPFTLPPQPLPHNECIYCEMVILFRNASNPPPPPGGWNGHVTVGSLDSAPLPLLHPVG